MSMRLEMLQVARLAPKLLDKSADAVAAFIKSLRTSEGGFQNRAGKSDLYYTVFGLECLKALQVDVPIEPIRSYLQSFGHGESLDFVHLTCLARCWANVDQQSIVPDVRKAILDRMETHRSADGGYHVTKNSPHGSTYACFLALGCYQDIGQSMPEVPSLLRCLATLRTPDGAYTNEVGLPIGMTTAVAAAATILRQFQEPVDDNVGDWLLNRCHKDGGFFAIPGAPIPDLLSTATALHALTSLHKPIDSIKESCLNYLDTLWVSQGAFLGSWADEVPDCEYTYYGLLALGHLSL